METAFTFVGVLAATLGATLWRRAAGARQLGSSLACFNQPTPSRRKGA